MVEQMYVEELRPLKPQKVIPIVLWHGMAQTGLGWIITPDARPGWASYFLSQGYTVYVVDSPERGRSSWLPGSGNLINVHAEYVQDFWTATKDNGDLWPQASLHTQWPGTGKLGDPYFDSFMAGQIQSRSDYARTEELAGKLGAELLKKIGPAYLFAHSQGGSHGWKIADLVPDLVKAIVALEPVGTHSLSSLALFDAHYYLRSSVCESYSIRYEESRPRRSDTTLWHHNYTHKLRSTVIGRR